MSRRKTERQLYGVVMSLRRDRPDWWRAAMAGLEDDNDYGQTWRELADRLEEEGDKRAGDVRRWIEIKFPPRTMATVAVREKYGDDLLRRMGDAIRRQPDYLIGQTMFSEDDSCLVMKADADGTVWFTLRDEIPGMPAADRTSFQPRLPPRE